MQPGSHNHEAQPGLDTLIDRFQRVLPQLAEVAAQPTARVPDLVQATDPVTVTFAADGLPSRIEVSPDWRRTTAAELAGAAPGKRLSATADLGRVVTDLCRRANAARVEAVAGAMTASGWTDRVADLFTSLTGGALPPHAPRVSPPPLASPPPAPPAPRAPGRSTRSLDAIVADLVQASAALDDAVASAGQQPDTTVAGTGGRGRLQLRVDPSGEVGCSADPEWVAGREVDELNSAFAAAVAELRAAREAGTAVPQRLLEANARLAADLQALMESTYGRGSASG